MAARAVALVILAFVSVPLSAQFATEPQRREALHHYREGQQLMAAEQFQKAADAFRQAVEHDHLFALAHFGEGQAYMGLRRFVSAARAFAASRDAFRALHQLAQENRDAVERRRQDEILQLRDLARQLGADRTGRRDAALARMEARLSELERRYLPPAGRFEPPPFLSLALGSAYFRNDQLNEAELEWKAAAAADERFSEAHNNLAALYAMTGRKQEAEAAVRAAERAGFRIHPQLKADIQNMASASTAELPRR